MPSVGYVTRDMARKKGMRPKVLCSIRTCDNYQYCRGLCQRHYSMARRKVPLQKMTEIRPPRLTNKDTVPITSRVDKATWSRLQQEVKEGRAHSVFTLVRQILQEWKPSTVGNG